MKAYKGWLGLLGALVAALFVVTQVLLIVHEGEAVVVTTFGKPAAAARAAPGASLRWPWPVQQAHRFDLRAQWLSGAAEQSTTRDSRSVIVALDTGWRIADPVRFLERAGTTEAAARGLRGLVSNAKLAVIGRHNFADLVNADAAKLQLDAIENEVLDDVAPRAKDLYGIAVDAVALRRIGLPEAVTAEVYKRQRAALEKVSKNIRDAGEAEARVLRAEADSERERRLAQADADARRLRAQGDAEAAASYAVFEQDPELAMFLRKLDVLEETLGKKATVVLGADTAPFDLLGGETALPAAARRPETPAPK